jgi:sulfoxide reductase heme-binding subunit YedZ
VTNYTDPGQHFFWISSRAFGIVALVLIALSVGFGIAISARASNEPAYMRQVHEATALAGLIAIAIHAALLLGDTYLKPGVAGITIPFVLSTARIWTAVGVISAWLAAILGLSFYARKWIGTQRWRRMHRWSLAVYVLGIAHGVGSGTDGLSLWLIAIIVATGIPVVLMAFYRYMPSQEPAAGRT